MSLLDRIEPHGGVVGLRGLVSAWRKRFQAVSAEVRPVVEAEGLALAELLRAVSSQAHEEALATRGLHVLESVCARLRHPDEVSLPRAELECPSCANNLVLRGARGGFTCATCATPLVAPQAGECAA